MIKFHEKIISFFKNHNLYNKEIFDYLEENTTLIDYNDEEQRDFVGCLYIVDSKKKLKKIHLVIPYIYDEITVLVSIHELIHGIELYERLNKKIKNENNIEILPMLYEKIYVEETKNESLFKFQKQLDSKISEKDKKYLIALAVREELYKEYNHNITKMQRKAKKVAKKYY